MSKIHNLIMFLLTIVIAMSLGDNIETADTIGIVVDSIFLVINGLYLAILRD